jgi:hypothetical protein
MNNQRSNTEIRNFVMSFVFDSSVGGIVVAEKKAERLAEIQAILFLLYNFNGGRYYIFRENLFSQDVYL